MYCSGIRHEWRFMLAVIAGLGLPIATRAQQHGHSQRPVNPPPVAAAKAVGIGYSRLTMGSDVRVASVRFARIAWDLQFTGKFALPCPLPVGAAPASCPPGRLGEILIDSSSGQVLAMQLVHTSNSGYPSMAGALDFAQAARVARMAVPTSQHHRWLFAAQFGRLSDLVGSGRCHLAACADGARIWLITFSGVRLRSRGRVDTQLHVAVSATAGKVVYTWLSNARGQCHMSRAQARCACRRDLRPEVVGWFDGGRYKRKSMRSMPTKTAAGPQRRYFREAVIQHPKGDDVSPSGGGVISGVVMVGRSTAVCV